MIFVDTSAFAALILPDESRHAAARGWFASNAPTLVTTDYVLDEALTLLKVRAKSKRALAFGESVLSGELAELHLLTCDDIMAAWSVFRKFSDKEWSFTDCTSKVVMERLGIGSAFTFDRHFRQFGAIEIVPPQD